MQVSRIDLCTQSISHHFLFDSLSLSTQSFAHPLRVVARVRVVSAEAREEPHGPSTGVRRRLHDTQQRGAGRTSGSFARTVRTYICHSPHMSDAQRLQCISLRLPTWPARHRDMAHFPSLYTSSPAPSLSAPSSRASVPVDPAGTPRTAPQRQRPSHRTSAQRRGCATGSAAEPTRLGSRRDRCRHRNPGPRHRHVAAIGRLEWKRSGWTVWTGEGGAEGEVEEGERMEGGRGRKSRMTARCADRLLLFFAAWMGVLQWRRAQPRLAGVQGWRSG